MTFILMNGFWQQKKAEDCGDGGEAELEMENDTP